MKHNPLRTGAIIRTAFVSLELLVGIVFSVLTFGNSGAEPWGYWGNVFAVYVMLSPFLLYVIASAIFNAFNMAIIFQNRHTPKSIQKYYKRTLIFLVWGTVTGTIYGFVFVPIFVLENVFLFFGYGKEREKLQNPPAL